MPAAEIMKKFKAHQLHSGKSGKIVTNPAQARAIEISYARKEGYDIPPPPRGKRPTRSKRG